MPREGNEAQAARVVQGALPHAAGSHNMAYYYVTWMVNAANRARVYGAFRGGHGREESRGRQGG
jgi:hypothetical protein